MLVQSLRRACYARSSVRGPFCSYLTRTMASDSGRPDHLQRTSHNTRATIESHAIVRNITDLSSTVKGITLQVSDKSLKFLPGQWVDFTIPGVDTVGGYSMSSAPNTLEEKQEMELAVKYSKHPPAHWVHTKCRVGSEVSVRVGGDFFYSPSGSGPQHSLLLVAGGVGVNPIYSILQYAAHLAAGVRVSVLYTAQTMEELVFKEEIQHIADSNKDIRCRFFITREKEMGNGDSITWGRIDQATLEQEVQYLQEDNTPVTSYICGPGAMIDAMETSLQQLGLDQAHIAYEKWW